jgi:hypothetical protein
MRDDDPTRAQPLMEVTLRPTRRAVEFSFGHPDRPDATTAVFPVWEGTTDQGVAVEAVIAAMGPPGQLIPAYPDPC